jgi:hypothetical protein
LWLTEGAPAQPPYDIGDNSLFVAFAADAELRVHLALGWSLPVHVLDLYVELRWLWGGIPPPAEKSDPKKRYSLLNAATLFDLDCIDASEKRDLRALAVRGGPYSAEERRALMVYCQEDVDITAQLLMKMLPKLELWHAIHRGRYMRAVSRIIRTGVPIDLEYLEWFRQAWDRIKLRLVQEVDRNYGVYDGTSFRKRKWLGYLRRERIPWPSLEDGSPDLKEETFSDMAKIYPCVRPIHELRYSLGKMRLSELQVGADGRNRCGLGVFRSKTSRNQPSNSEFVFGPATYLRSLIKPERDRSLVHADWSAQEYGIAAYRSKDTDMMADYQSGDPYLAFAKRAGAVPADATKRSHPKERELYKVCCGLGAMYGAGGYTLATRLNVSPAHARELLDKHRNAYKRYWEWSNNLQNFARLKGCIHSQFRWRLKVDYQTKPGTVSNFPMQGDGAEMMRWGCILATESGLNVCCPVHDALMVEAATADIDQVVEQTQAIMRQASELVLPGFPLRTEAKVVSWPDRYLDPRGADMWTKICRLLDEDASQKGWETVRPPMAGVAGHPWPPVGHR